MCCSHQLHKRPSFATIEHTHRNNQPQLHSEKTTASQWAQSQGDRRPSIKRYVPLAFLHDFFLYLKYSTLCLVKTEQYLKEKILPHKPTMQNNHHQSVIDTLVHFPRIPFSWGHIFYGWIISNTQLESFLRRFCEAKADANLPTLPPASVLSGLKGAVVRSTAFSVDRHLSSSHFIKKPLKQLQDH